MGTADQVKRSPMPPRTSPMPRSRKPLPRRNAVRRPPEKATAQREAVLERDGYRCVFVVLDEGWREIEGYLWRYGEWGRCPITGSGNLRTCHVFRRRHCGSAVYDPDVAVAGCDAHHKAFDRHERDGLRLPEYVIERARNAINAVCLPENRLPETMEP